MIIIVYRDLGKVTAHSTSGEMYIDGRFFCYTLEDALRHPAVKIAGHTCIPACTLSVDLSISNRFGRLMPILYNQADKKTAIINGNAWAGLRIHGGNTSDDTAGCILVAKNRISNDKIHGTQEAALTSMIQAAINRGEGITLTIAENGY
jgi:hypothetical protein